VVVLKVRGDGIEFRRAFVHRSASGEAGVGGRAEVVRARAWAVQRTADAWADGVGMSRVGGGVSRAQVPIAGKAFRRGGERR
jgi:hypothetical protein